MKNYAYEVRKEQALTKAERLADAFTADGIDNIINREDKLGFVQVILPDFIDNDGCYYTLNFSYETGMAFNE